MTPKSNGGATADGTAGGVERLAPALAAFAGRLTFEAIPPTTSRRLKALVLDQLGAAAAGMHAEGVPEIRRRLRSIGGAPESTVLFDGARLPAGNAALANGTAGHAAELDDIHPEAHVHTLAVVLPAALAAAEQRGDRTGAELLTAMAAGIETICRLSLAAPIERGWHPTSTYGTYGAAVAAATISGFGTNRIEAALAIAASLAAGTRQPAVEGRLVKRMHAGLAAQRGVDAAGWAAVGITGPAAPFEGVFGHYAVYENSMPRIARALEGLGDRWELGKLEIKRYACCAFCHASIDAALGLRPGILRRLNEIDTIEVYASATAVDLVGATFDSKPSTTIAAAQFSIPYTVASALRSGAVGPAEFTGAARHDPFTQALARRVRVTLDPSIPARALGPSVLIVRFRDGSSARSSSADYSRTGTEDAAIDAKFRDGLSILMDRTASARFDRIRSATLELDTLSVAEFVELLVPALS